MQTIAVSDGALFYAADLVNGGLQNRARLQLNSAEHSPDAWWLSVDGIYRPATTLCAAPAIQGEPAVSSEAPEAPRSESEVLLHHKHRVPAECFAYVGDASDTTTWKLPYRLSDGSVDQKHLAGAIRAVLSNYRGAHVDIPESAIEDVLVRLGRAAAEIRKLQSQTPKPLASYQLLYDALHQKDRLSEVVA